MAWFGLDKLLLGTDLTAEQARGNQLDAQITAANQQLENQGAVPAGYTAAASADINAGNLSTGASDVVSSVDGEFVAGAQQGLSNVLAAPGKVVGAVGGSASSLLWGIVKNIPWWVWIAALGAIFVWMGGLELLRGRLARR
jgi:hypothetical protein